MNYKESKLQAEVFQYLHNKYCLKNIKLGERAVIFKVENEGKRDFKQQAISKATGTLSGVSDLIFIHKKRSLFLEAKTGYNKQSEKQIDFQNTIEAQGMVYIVFYTLEELLEKLSPYL